MKIFSLPADIKALIFDLDSTLYTCPDYAEAQVKGQIQRLADKRGQSFVSTLEEIETNRNSWSASHEGKKLSLGNAFVHFGVSIAESIRWREELIHPRPYLKPDKRLIEALSALRVRFSLALVTNNPALVGRRTLSALGVEAFFQTVVGLDTCGVSKPHEAPFLKAAADLGVQASGCVSIGDRYDIDIALPLELGMGGILVDGVHDVYALTTTLEIG